MSELYCKICLEPIQGGTSDYHSSCSRKLFGTAHPPKLPYSGKDLDALAEQVVRQHIAVPGVQPKLSLHLDRSGRSDSGRLTLVGLEGGYILKPSVEKFPEMPELEHLTIHMARGLGIETAECGIIELEDGKKALIVLRMDRVKGEKLAMEDMCQLGDKLAEEKYRGSMESVGRIILKYCANPGFDALRFYELMLFCFLTGNADMHFKNFSLIRSSEGEIRFSPAYDLLPTLAPRCFKWVKTRYRGIIRKSGNQEKKGRNAGYQPPRTKPLPIHGSEKREGPNGYQVMAFQSCPDWLRDLSHGSSSVRILNFPSLPEFLSS